MSVSSEMRTQSIMLTVPAQIIKEADSVFPRVDLGALTVMLLEKYLRHQKRKLLAQQYRQYYQTLAVSMGDREADIYELFALAHQAHNSPSRRRGIGARPVQPLRRASRKISGGLDGQPGNSRNLHH